MRALKASYLRRRTQTLERVFRDLTLERLPPKASVHLIYDVMLGRWPDTGGFADRVRVLESGILSRADLVQTFRGSEEFQNRPYTANSFGASIHAGRCQFVKSLPKARRIVDLGGTHLASDDGAMVGLGYPYEFDELVIVDLPSDDRHEIYRSGEVGREIRSRRGPVRYRYHSMTQLGSFEDASVDLVYSGQSIEHVTVDEARLVLKDSFRMLRPGGHFACDTPNGRVTRLQQTDLIDPDHKVEYRWPELREMLEAAGFEIVEAKGLNYAGPSLAAGVFDVAQVSAASGIYDELEDCYILCCVARKPGATS